MKQRIKDIFNGYEALLARKNVPEEGGNGVFTRYKYPVLTAAHTPPTWRYDLDPASNPHMMERIGVNTVMNSGAIKLNGKYYIIARVEGYDRKSFFAVAESDNGVDGFRFWEYPVVMPETDDPDTNVTDVRLIAQEAGWIFRIFCTEGKDAEAPK